MTAIVSTSGLTALHSGKPYLRYPDITVQPGDRVHLCGPSGSGKTTFLRLIAGLVRPHQGVLRIAARRTAYAFQEPRLIPDISGVNNLQVATGVSCNDAETLLTRVGLSHALHQPCRSLSGGEAQRVNLCRALLGRPDLILIDEGATGLDEEGRKLVTDAFDELSESFDPAVIEVAHSPGEPLFVARPNQTLSLSLA